jgi:hypothetical protein
MRSEAPKHRALFGSVREEQGHRAVLEQRLRRAAEHHLAQTRMHISSHHDHVGPDQASMMAQCLGDVTIQGGQGQFADLDAVAGEMRGKVGTRDSRLQILLSRDADQFDVRGLPQERQGVIERPCRLGTAIPRGMADEQRIIAQVRMRHGDLGDKAAATVKPH